MQYKNLNSLGRAYRAGNVDRSTYIKQRRKIIDDFTGPVEQDDQNGTVSDAEMQFDEASTIISTATALAEGGNTENSATQNTEALPRKYLFAAVGLILLLVATIFFFFVSR